MARCRNIKPGFFSNELLAELPPLTRLLFAGLWCYADREGRLEDRPKRIKAEILPYDDCDVDDALDTLAAGDDPFIYRYEVGGNRYIQVAKFSDNQAPHHTEKPSVIPGFPLNNESLTGTLQPPIKVRGNQESVSSSEAISSEVNRKGDARGKPKLDPACVPVPEGFETPAVRQAIRDWLEFKAGRGESYKDGAYLGRKIAEFSTPSAFIAAVNSSIGNNYAGVFPAKQLTGRDPRGNYATAKQWADK